MLSDCRCNIARFQFLLVCVQAFLKTRFPALTTPGKAIRQSYAYHQLRSCTAVSFLIIYPTTESYGGMGRVEYGEREMSVITSGREG